MSVVRPTATYAPASSPPQPAELRKTSTSSVWAAFRTIIGGCSARLARAAAATREPAGCRGQRGERRGERGLGLRAVRADARGDVAIDAVRPDGDARLDLHLEALRGQRLDATRDLRARDDELVIAEERAVPAARLAALGLELVLALLELLVLAGRLAVHVGLGRARPVAALDAVLIAAAVDGHALGVALAVAVGVPRRLALRRVGRDRALRVTVDGAFTEAVHGADDVHAIVAVRLALGVALVRAARRRRQRALRVADRHELGGASNLVDPEFATSPIALGRDVHLAVRQSLEPNVAALRHALGVRRKSRRKTDEYNHQPKKARASHDAVPFWMVESKRLYARPMPLGSVIFFFMMVPRGRSLTYEVVAEEQEGPLRTLHAPLSNT